MYWNNSQSGEEKENMVGQHTDGFSTDDYGYTLAIPQHEYTPAAMSSMLTLDMQHSRTGAE